MFVVCFKGEYGNTTWTDSRVLALNRYLEILRVVFEPADDQQVFQSPRNKQLAVDEHTEIACTQIWSTAIVVEPGAKRLRSFFLASPVAFGDAR
jgi:hypothetical protein